MLLLVPREANPIRAIKLLKLLFRMNHSANTMPHFGALSEHRTLERVHTYEAPT